MKEWRLIFTQAWRKPDFQELIEKEFDGKEKVEVTREELEHLVVLCCSIMMEKT